MADGTGIEWTEATWNPITGCSLASPGCTNCYAMKLAGTRLQHHPSRTGLTINTKAGPVWTGETRLNEGWLDQPLRWKRPRMIFVCAHGDLFHESVPDEWIDRVFAIMALASQHTFQVLTKRSARMREYVSNWVRGHNIARQVLDRAIADPSLLNHEPWPVQSLGDIDAPDDVTISWPLPNVWLGVSVEDQARAEERIPHLLATPAAVRFISAEPLLGPLNLEAWLAPWEFCQECDDGEGYGNRCNRSDIPLDEQCPWTRAVQIHHEHGPFTNDGEPASITSEVRKLDWVIAGGESGNGARPMHPDWARSLRDQCAEAGVPFFFKQWGEFMPIEAVANDSGGVDFAPPAPIGNLMRWRKWEGDNCRLPRRDESAGEWFEPGMFAAPAGKNAAGRLLDGAEHNGFPEGL